ncbi:glycosyltransferase family 2 protein [Psychromonas arctica]|uniref:glycosyltransferase family 2 protein n=1 Tax=Psychromonas arctica TaxID=168275 RepID=UPI002FD417FB
MTVHVSLICPVYKVAAYLPELMQSLLAGVNSEKVEVIFVDDCCPEQSIAVCEQFINERAELIKFQYKVIKQPVNKGQAAARNTALAVAQGEYIGFIDSDDAISPYYWETLSSYVVDAQYDIIEFTFEEFKDTLPEPSKAVATELSTSNLNPFHYGFFVWTRLYKKSIVDELRFPEGMIFEDIFYNVHAFSEAKSTLRLSSCLVFYRKREGSTTSGRTSSYSNLLLNLVNSTTSTIECFQDKTEVISQVVRYSFLVSLKGFTIKERSDRRHFFKQCEKINLSFTPLLKQFDHSVTVKLKFKLSQLICSIGKFL